MPTYNPYCDDSQYAMSDSNDRESDSNPADWPRRHTYVPSSHTCQQGYHPPAPTFQANQFGMSGMNPYSYGGYGYNQPAAAQAQAQFGHAAGYYSSMQTPGFGWPYNPYTFPLFTSYPFMMSSRSWTAPSNLYSSFLHTAYPAQHPMIQPNPYMQMQSSFAMDPYNRMNAEWGTVLGASAAAQAANLALSQTPTAPNYFVGATRAEIDMQNAVLAQSSGAMMPGMPGQVAPYKPAAGQQFWCKEMDGSWTLRSHGDVQIGEVAPGHWEKHATSGYFYWVRH